MYMYMYMPHVFKCNIATRSRVCCIRVGCSAEQDLLDDDGEAEDVAFLCSSSWTFRHPQ